jgi:hypothetical protein
MSRFRSRRFFTLLSVLGVAGLSVAAVARGTCEEGGTPSMAVLASSLTTTVGNTLSFTVENTGSISFQVQNEDFANSNFSVVKACLGINISPGTSCSTTTVLKCVKKGETHYIVLAQYSLSSLFLLKCT